MQSSNPSSIDDDDLDRKPAALKFPEKRQSAADVSNNTTLNEVSYGDFANVAQAPFASVAVALADYCTPLNSNGISSDQGSTAVTDRSIKLTFSHAGPAKQLLNETSLNLNELQNDHRHRELESHFSKKSETANNTAGVINLAVGGSLKDNLDILPTILFDEIPEATKNNHRNLLLKLFCSNEYDKKRLEKLAKSCGVLDFHNLHSFIRPDFDCHDCFNSIRIDPSLPHIIGNVAKIERQRALTTMWENENEVGKSDRRRSGYSALPLHELEETSRRWYLRSLDSWDKPANKDTSNREKPPSPARFFSLKFNEGSLCLISRWSGRNRGVYDQPVSSNVVDCKVAKSVPRKCLRQNVWFADEETVSVPNNDEGQRVRDTHTKEADIVKVAPIALKQHTVNPRFRKCSICCLWGHYEFECSKLSPHNIIEFADGIQKISKSDSPVPARPSITAALRNALIGGNSGQPVVNSAVVTGRSFLHKQEGTISKFPVCVELYQGFLFEQRSEPESFLRLKPSRKKKKRSAPVLYDESFEIDGFKIRGSTSLKGLAEGHLLATSTKRKRQKTNRCTGYNTLKRQKSTKTCVTKGLDSCGKSKFCVGDMVAWFKNSQFASDPSASNEIVLTGLVAKFSNVREKIFDDNENEVGIQYLGSIPAKTDEISILSSKAKPAPPHMKKSFADVESPITIEGARLQNDDTSITQKNPLSGELAGSDITLEHATNESMSFGSLIWVAESELYLVEESVMTSAPEELRSIKRKYVKWKVRSNSYAEIDGQEKHVNVDSKDSLDLSELGDEGNSSSISRIRSRSQSYSERFKKSGRLEEDMSLAPKKPARLLSNGNYSMPQGRRPVGLLWDSKRGVWSLPTRQKKTKGTSSKIRL